MRKTTHLAVGLLSATLAVGGLTSPVAAAESPEPRSIRQVPRAGVVAPPQLAPQFTLTAVWAGCGWKDNKYKTVRVFTRHRATATTGQFLRGGKSDLHCGTERWGYRHILERHLDEWQTMAALAQENWRDTADYSIKWALRDPDRVTYRSARKTFCFQRSILLVDERNGHVAGQRDVSVVVARESKNIITALPGPCRKSEG